MKCEIILLSMVQYAALNETLSCQCWNVKRIWWKNTGINNIQTGAAEMGKFWRYFAGSWSRHSSTLRRQHVVVGRQWQGIPSSLAGCPLFSRVIDWGKRLLFVFLSLLDLAEWAWSLFWTVKISIQLHGEHTFKDNRKQQALPLIFFLPNQWLMW